MQLDERLSIERALILRSNYFPAGARARRTGVRPDEKTVFEPRHASLGFAFKKKCHRVRVLAIRGLVLFLLHAQRNCSFAKSLTQNKSYPKCFKSSISPSSALYYDDYKKLRNLFCWSDGEDSRKIFRPT